MRIKARLKWNYRNLIHSFAKDLIRIYTKLDDIDVKNELMFVIMEMNSLLEDK